MPHPSILRTYNHKKQNVERKSNLSDFCKKEIPRGRVSDCEVILLDEEEPIGGRRTSEVSKEVKNISDNLINRLNAGKLQTPASEKRDPITAQNASLKIPQSKGEVLPNIAVFSNLRHHVLSNLERSKPMVKEVQVIPNSQHFTHLISSATKKIRCLVPNPLSTFARPGPKSSKNGSASVSSNASSGGDSLSAKQKSRRILPNPPIRDVEPSPSNLNAEPLLNESKTVSPVKNVSEKIDEPKTTKSRTQPAPCSSTQESDDEQSTNFTALPIKNAILQNPMCRRENLQNPNQKTQSRSKKESLSENNPFVDPETPPMINEKRVTRRAHQLQQEKDEEKSPQKKPQGENSKRSNFPAKNQSNKPNLSRRPISSKISRTVRTRSNRKLTAKSNRSQLSNLKNTQLRSTKTAGNVNRKSWTAQCIICGKSFHDKYEFHRHATLDHPSVQIVFCELCSDSFFTYEELKDHRKSYHKITVLKDEPARSGKKKGNPKSAGKKEDEDSQTRRRRLDSRRPLNRNNFDDNFASLQVFPGHSRAGHEKHRNLKLLNKKGVASSARSKNWKLEKLAQRRKKLQTAKVQSQESTSKKPAVGKSGIKNFELKHLIVPIVRLEGPTLEKYMKKLEVSPVKNSRKNGDDQSREKKSVTAPRRGLRMRNPAEKVKQNSDNLSKNQRAVKSVKKSLDDPNSDKKSTYSDSDETSDNSDDNVADHAPSTEMEVLSRPEQTKTNERQDPVEIGKKQKTSGKIVSKSSDSNFKKNRPKKSTEDFESSNSSRRNTRLRSSSNNEQTSEFAKSNEPLSSPSNSAGSMLCEKSSPYRRSARLEASKIDEKLSNNEATANNLRSAPQSTVANVESSKDAMQIESENENRVETVIKIGGSNEKTNESIDCEDPKERKIEKIAGRTEQLINALREEHKYALDSGDLIVTNRGNDLEKSISVENQWKKNEMVQIIIQSDVNVNSSSTESSQKIFQPIKVRPADRCLRCIELSNAMKKIRVQATERGGKETPLKCPLCSRYFISVFHLTLHVSKNHLQCRRKFPCEPWDEMPDEVSRKAIEVDQSMPQIIAEFPAKKKRATGVNCSRCDKKFSKIVDYVHHFDAVHKSPAPNKQEKSGRFDGKSVPSSSKENSSARKLPKVTPADQNEKDREDLLNQLMSDDSNGPEENTPDNPLFNSLQSRKLIRDRIRDSTSQTKIEPPTLIHTCEACQSTFTRAQDLIAHALDHVEIPLKKANDPPTPRDASNDRNSELFADLPPGHGTTPAESGKIVGKATAIKIAGIDDRIIGKNVDNSPVAFEKSILRQTQTIGVKRKAALPLDKPSSKSRKTIVDSVKREPGKNNETNEGSAIEELLETEKSLADEATNSENRPLECHKCNRNFANRAALNEHLFYLHDDTLKDTLLTDILPLSEPMKLDEENTKGHFYCNDCQQHFKMMQAFCRHRYYHHGDSSLVHVCENCSKVLTTVMTVNVHICTDVTSYNCRNCKLAFRSGLYLRVHNTERHLETKGPHSCEICDKNFLTGSMLDRHKKCEGHFFEDRRESSSVRITPTAVEDAEKLKITAPKDDRIDSGCDEISDETDSTIGKNNSLLDTRKSRGKKKISMPRSTGHLNARRILRQKKRGRPRKSAMGYRQRASSFCTFNPKPVKADFSLKSKSIFIQENDLHQCSICQLFCLSRSTLDSHMSSVHSKLGEICQLCQRMYPTGKLLRHMIDNHICSNDSVRRETSWQFGRDCNEIDTEIFVRLLGSLRLISLCEYRRYTDKNADGYSCPNCTGRFRSIEIYRYHFLLHHDTMCALCNIEFKTGHDAARHKSDVHGSVGRYIWFADRTILALMKTKNFHDVAERSFFDMLTMDEAMEESSEENEDFGNENIEDFDCKRVPEDELTFEDIEDAVSRQNSILGMTNGSFIEEGGDSSGRVAEIPKEKDLVKLGHPKEEIVGNDSTIEHESNDLERIIVINADDLERFNIGSRYPNIWGLSAKISSTADDMTPKEVKDILERYFERTEDVDATLDM